MKPFEIVPGDSSPLGRARLSLEGLSVGDAFGERFFVSPSLVESLIGSRAIPADPWYWTDDTAMALSIFEHLRERGSIDQEPLAQSFASRYRRDPRRGYGGTAHGILTAISLGEHAGIPPAFVDAREPLDSDVDYLERHAEEVRLGRRPR